MNNRPSKVATKNPIPKYMTASIMTPHGNAKSPSSLQTAASSAAAPRVVPPTLSYLLSLEPSKFARCHAQSSSQRAHNPMSDDATPVRSFYAILFRVRHPVPRCAYAYKSDCGSSFPVPKKKLAAPAAVMRVNYIYDCSADLRSIVLIRKAMTFLLQSMIIS
jgi:hypothetical protein